MKNWINKIGKDKFQRYLFIGVLILVFGVFFISLSLLPSSDVDDIKDPDGQLDDDDDNDDDDDVDNDDDDEDVYEEVKFPVDSESTLIIRKYWELNDEIEDQEMSLIVMGGSYDISRGVSYVNSADPETSFEVKSSMSGTVTKVVTDSPLYGKTVEIDHGDGITTEYISLSEVVVSEGDEVSQGDVIGTSGVSEYDQAAKNHVHFKISINGDYRNPEELIGKKTNEIE